MLLFMQVMGTLTTFLIASLLVDHYWLSKKSALPALSRESRRTPRFLTQCPVTYHDRIAGGQGLVLNMSREGWRVRGTSPVRDRTTLTLSITVPSVDEPIPIKEAVVRWSNGLEFGVQLIDLDPGAAACLSDYIRTLEKDPHLAC